MVLQMIFSGVLSVAGGGVVSHFSFVVQKQILCRSPNLILCLVIFFFGFNSYFEYFWSSSCLYRFAAPSLTLLVVLRISHWFYYV